jgi:eukaryotic-like serine/threonine-protein kinase
MIPEHDLELGDRSRVQAMLAFDRALITDGVPPAVGDENPSLEAIYNCQRLLEEVWPRSLPTPDEPPRQFGRYVILRELGRGAFGVVFLASDSVLGRKVALKVPRPLALVTPEVRRRFVREAEAASRLDHPHIVPVYDVGEEGPICYIASAYCEGLNLADWLRSRKAPVAFLDAARLVAILSAAVGHAHQRGILHRDLKPSNILLRPLDPAAPKYEALCSDLGFIPRICDFGLAKLLDQDSHETCSGVPIGSPSYMAPEQAAGRLRDHGPATDVYALGAILYELLTGRPPLRGETDLETLRLVSEQEPPPLRGLRKGTPRDLDTICLKCLEKQPKARYASAAGLAEDLERFLAGKAVRARPVRAWQRAGKWSRRQPMHAALLAVSVITVSTVLGVVLWSGTWMQKHRQNLTNAIAQREREVQQAERSALDVRIEEALAGDRKRFDERYEQAKHIKLVHYFFDAGDVITGAHMLVSSGLSHGGVVRRGFAWGYLRAQVEPEVTRLGKLEKADSPTLVLAVTRDSRILAAGKADGRIELWDLNEMRLLRTHVHSPPRKRGEVYTLRFSPDNRLLAAGTNDRNVKIWDVATGAFVGEVPQPPEKVSPQLGQIHTLSFTDGSDYLVIAHACPRPKTRGVVFWKLREGGGDPEFAAMMNQDDLPKYGKRAPFQRSTKGAGGVTTPPWISYAQEHLMMLDDGESLAIKEHATGVTLYNDERRVARVYGPLDAVALNEREFVGLTKEEIAWWSERAFGLLGTAGNSSRRTFPPWGVPEFSPDGRTLVFWYHPLGAILVDVATNRMISAYAPTPRFRIVDQIHTADGRYLVMGGFHSQIHVWHLKPREIAAHEKEVWSLAFSPDGSSLASGADDHTIKLWDMASARERTTLKAHESLVTAVAYSPDGKVLASASFDKTIRLWDAATRQHLATLRGHVDRVRALAFSPDGGTLATAGDDRSIQLWDVAGRRELSSPLDGHSGTVFSLAFAPDGETLFSGSTDKTIRLWDRGATYARAVWQADDQVYSLALSPDGKSLAAAHHGGTVSLWDVSREKVRARWKAHANEVLTVRFSPDGLTLASTGNDKMVRIWDPVTTQPLLMLQGHEAPVHAAAFSRDGTILATGSHDGKIKLWRALPDEQPRHK